MPSTELADYRKDHKMGATSQFSFEKASMPKRKHFVLSDEIDRFFDLFTPTMNLVERLIADRQNAQEVLLLLCARPRCFASCISSEDKSNRESFTKLVTAFSGERTFMESISVGDLYYEL